ncbi:MAG: glycosyltransferase family 1 protein [Cyanobacteria bacterium P01_D01_bin.73]
MKILLVSNYLPDGQQSMQRFAALLEQEIKQTEHTVKVSRPVPVLGYLKRSPYGIGKWLGYIDKFLIFPLILRWQRRWADVVHICDHSNAFYSQHLRGVPHLVTCHDLLAVRSALGEIPENPTKWTGQKLQDMIVRGLNRSQLVVCVSESTRQDLMRLTTVERSATELVYMGLNYPYLPMPFPERQGHLKQIGLEPDVPFLFHIGSDAWYKNRPGLLELFRQLVQVQGLSHLRLAIAGSPLGSHSLNFIAAHGLQEHVVELGSVSNEGLRALYSSAIAMLFPSLQEGFGWPIIEAQACGCPVFTSDDTPMTEVGGDAAVYINPRQPEKAAQIVADRLNPEDLGRMKEKGLANVDRFQPQTMIHRYFDAYVQAQNTAGIHAVG